jgi:sigma-B regulation protein RsbU (phosphoserine phosphatase)
MEIRLIDYMDNLATITAEKERIGAELSIATHIQADMLPRIFPAFPGRKEVDIYATMTPAKEVGGDFYDFFLIDENHVGLVMADVSGKGVPAALFMVIAKTLIKNRALMGGGPAEILSYVNEQLCEGNEAELFVTVWFAILDLTTGKGLAANAGHEHPAIRRAGGEYVLEVYRHSPAVATMKGMRFREHEFELHPGDSLFVYTDGVTEATNANNELFGNDRMLDALNEDPEATPEKLLPTVRRYIDNFVGDAPQFDDITMMCLLYKGQEGKSES